MLKRITRIVHRQPDVIIGDRSDPYLLRWHVIPRNRFFNIYLHHFLRSDDDRALHDHPWPSCSIILRGGYREHLPGGVLKIRKPGRITFRRASAAHRIELFDSVYLFAGDRLYLLETAWTIFITGPKVREWGFHCPQGWRHWREFIGVAHGEARGDEVGRGCE